MSKDRWKFRGKRTGTGEWVYGFYCGHSPSITFSHKHWIRTESKWERVDPKTVGQCLGFKDKNGVLVFEGDIPKEMMVIEFCSECFSMQPVPPIYECFSCSGDYSFHELKNDIIDGKEWVIGNKHDNPDLLKGISK